MKRSRTPLALFLCTFTFSLLAVGFADGESRPLTYACGLQPGDLDQLDLGYSPSCSLSVPRGVAACESSVNIDSPNTCPLTVEAISAADWITSVWDDFSPAGMVDSVARRIGDCSAYLAERWSGTLAQSTNGDDAQPQTVCADWITSERAAAEQAASDSQFLYALSGAWRTGQHDAFDCVESVDCFSGIDCFDGCGAIDRYLRNAKSAAAKVACATRECQFEDEAAILNRLSQGLPSCEADEASDEVAEEKLLMRFVAENFGPAYAVAISRHAPIRQRRYEGLWSGCDALPDASIAGWLDDAARAATLQTWRAIISPMADLAGRAAQGSQVLVSIVSQQIAGWLIERRANIATQSPPTPPSKASAPRNATRS
ncbi:MAG TPA: hypothetical protein VGJ26_16910, partial [Pirellulales bacterium]